MKDKMMISIFREERKNMLQEIDRGYDRNSINRHSWRRYKDTTSAHGQEYMLDRTTDTIPPYFQFYSLGIEQRCFDGKYRQSLHVEKINGLESWGDFLTWKKAEQLLQGIYK